MIIWTIVRWSRVSLMMRVLLFLLLLLTVTVKWWSVMGMGIVRMRVVCVGVRMRITAATSVTSVSTVSTPIWSISRRPILPTIKPSILSATPHIHRRNVSSSTVTPKPLPFSLPFAPFPFSFSFTSLEFFLALEAVEFLFLFVTVSWRL